MYFRNKRLRKTWLVKCLKSPILEHFWTVNNLNGPKHCWNLHQSTFIICFVTLRHTQMRLNQIQLSKKQKHFPNFLLHFWNLHQFLNILEKQAGLLPYLFSKLRIPNTAEIYTAAFLSYSFTTLKDIELENASLSDIRNPRTVC